MPMLGVHKQQQRTVKIRTHFADAKTCPFAFRCARRYVPMSNMPILVLLLILISPVSAEEPSEQATFYFSSSCVTSIDVGEVSYAPLWAVTINLDDQTAKGLHAFSEKYLYETVRMVDGDGNGITKKGITIRAPVSTPFQIAGLTDEKEAMSVKRRILSSNGACGER